MVEIAGVEVATVRELRLRRSLLHLHPRVPEVTQVGEAEGAAVVSCQHRTLVHTHRLTSS